ncbi:MAG: phosphoribosyl-ATP diphosphatase, partial [Gammaproteobacteria bacterium]
VIAAKSNENASIIHEIADLWFHVMVLLSYRDLRHEDVLKELHDRFGLSGLEEKANRNDQD